MACGDLNSISSISSSQSTVCILWGQKLHCAGGNYKMAVLDILLDWAKPLNGSTDCAPTMVWQAKLPFSAVQWSVMRPRLVVISIFSAKVRSPFLLSRDGGNNLLPKGGSFNPQLPFTYGTLAGSVQINTCTHDA